MRDEWEIREYLNDAPYGERDVLEWVLEQTDHMFYLGEHVMYHGHARAICGHDTSSNMYQIFYNCVYIWVSEETLEKIK